ncbi:hypothetical protein CP532_3110 [Ophiocordyceps camponoti-leonardi (nom. inval.)]|nr:hypothetical protein CP532_3110 [Ophiocordyceps camponoti-leonardi (nom. inval.)]
MMINRPSRPAYKRMPLEVAVYDPYAPFYAQQAGASRIELNAQGSYAVGGLTPTVDNVKYVRPRISVGLHITIRPRPAPEDGSPDYVYTTDEIEEMIESMEKFKNAGVLNPFRGDRFVLGALRKAIDYEMEENSTSVVRIDEHACRALLHAAKPFGCFFSHAFDHVVESGLGKEGADLLLRLGFEGIITAGGREGSCADVANVDFIDNLCHHFTNRLDITVGDNIWHGSFNLPASRLAVYDEGTVWLRTDAIRSTDDNGEPVIDYDRLFDLTQGLSSIQPDWKDPAGHWLAHYGHLATG